MQSGKKKKHAQKHNCQNCKHGDCNHYQEPCCQCVKEKYGEYSKWEAATSSSVDGCRTCLHTAKRGEHEPCCDCRMDKNLRWSKWEQMT